MKRFTWNRLLEDAVECVWDSDENDIASVPGESQQVDEKKGNAQGRDTKRPLSRTMGYQFPISQERSRGKRENPPSGTDPKRGHWNVAGTVIRFLTSKTVVQYRTV